LVEPGTKKVSASEKYQRATETIRAQRHSGRNVQQASRDRGALHKANTDLALWKGAQQWNSRPASELMGAKSYPKFYFLETWKFSMGRRTFTIAVEGVLRQISCQEISFSRSCGIKEAGFV
jgi:hypothetical protein